MARHRLFHLLMVGFTPENFFEPGSFRSLSEPPIGLILRGITVQMLAELPLIWSCFCAYKHAAGW